LGSAFAFATNSAKFFTPYRVDTATRFEFVVTCEIGASAVSGS
jgi:hypothetical protein